MIGSPQNNFKTMQPPQTMPQPRNVMLSNALRNPQGNDQEENRPQEQYETDEQNEQYRQPNPAWMSQNQYGRPTPQMSNWQMPQSNASYNLQPQLPGANADGMNQGGPIGLQQAQGQNRFGVGLASPRQMPQQLQVR